MLLLMQDGIRDCTTSSKHYTITPLNYHLFLMALLMPIRVAKPKPTSARYTGKIEPDTSYLCVTDNNILKVESITRPKEVWTVNLRYTQSQTKLGYTVGIVEMDFENEVKKGKFVKI